MKQLSIILFVLLFFCGSVFAAGSKFGRSATSEIIVQSDQTIQSVIDSCSVAIGSLKDGFTNPYIINVPPGHEKEYYSLVRNAANATSDKRNIEVVYEDNPENKFKVVSYEACEDIGDWTDLGGNTVLSLDVSHQLEGEKCFKLTNSDASGDMYLIKTVSLDLREYHGMLFDIETTASEHEKITFYLFDSISPSNKIPCIMTFEDNFKGKFRGTMFVPFFAPYSAGTNIDLSSIVKIQIRCGRKAGYTGATTVYFDNIRFIRTTPHHAAVFTYHDSYDGPWTYLKYLDAKNWKVGFCPTYLNTLGAANGRMSFAQIKAVYDNGHDVIGKSINHSLADEVGAAETYYEFNGGLQWMEQHGFLRAANLYMESARHSSEDLKNCLRNANILGLTSSFNPFPARWVDVSNPNFAIPDGLQNYIDMNHGGIIHLILHDITNGANYSTFLDWVEDNFSEVLLPSQVIARLPSEVYGGTQAKSFPQGVIKTLAADYTFEQFNGGCLILDPAGARNCNPIGIFKPFHRVEVINKADAAESITFEPTFTAAGTHDGSANATDLTDSGESWVANQLVGKLLTNTTDGSNGTIADNNATRITALLVNGTDNDWDIGDNYTIAPAGLNEAVDRNERGTFVYDGAGGWLKVYVGS